MGRRGLAGGNDPSDRGVPTPRARRPRLASAAAALLLAGGLAARAAATATTGRGFVALAAGLGVALLLAGLLALWEDGLVAGALLLLAAYTLSLVTSKQPLDRTAPLVAAALLAIVDLGSWSLELDDGAEERPLSHLPTLGLLSLAAAATAAAVLAVGTASLGGGLGFWLIGTAAAAALLTMIARPTRSSEAGPDATSDT
jgi:hypothetical protein